MSLKSVFKDYVSGLGVMGWIRIILFVFLVSLLIYQCGKTVKYERILKDTHAVKIVPKTPITIQAEEINREVNKKGQDVVTFEQAEPIIKFIEIAVEDNARVDSVLKLANVEKNKVVSLTSINGSLLKENTDLKREVQVLASGSKDTVFRYSDPWFSAEGFRKNDTVFTLRNITANLSVNKIDHQKKKFWFFGQNQNLSTVYFESPYARVNGLEALSVKQSEPFLGFNIDLEGKYLHLQKEVLVGPRMGVKFGRVTVNGGYYLNPGGKIGNGLWYGAAWKVY